jgi:hypothetical protein
MEDFYPILAHGEDVTVFNILIYAKRFCRHLWPLTAIDELILHG